jgi:VWFA-related protein
MIRKSGSLSVIALFWGVLVLSLILSAQQPNETAPPSPPAKIVVRVNSVLVPVVVRDSQGRAMGSLKKEDFQLFDKNKPQVISGFSIQERRSSINNAASTGAGPSPAPAASAGPAASQPAPAAPGRFIVFLFDDMHLSAGDLSQVQKVAAKMVTGALTDSDMAAVVAISGTSSGLTRDRAKLQDAIMNLKAQNPFRPIGRSCPTIEYYEADRIENKRDLIVQDAAVDAAMACCECSRELAITYVEDAARRALQLGDQDIHMTLVSLGNIVRKLGAMGGQRTLILISPGFLTVSAESEALKSAILDMAAELNVTVSAVDARGLYTTVLDASTDTTKDSQRSARTQSEYRGDSMQLNENIMAELADGTGGKYFHNSNDLQAGFQILTEVPEYVYLLEMSLQNVKQDGAYHLLKVKVDQNGLSIQARRGYFAPKPEKSKK